MGVKAALKLNAENLVTADGNVVYNSIIPFETVKIKLGGVPESSKLNVENLNNSDKFSSSEILEISLSKKRSSVIFEYHF